MDDPNTTNPGDPNGYLDGLKYYKDLNNDINEATRSEIDEAAQRIPSNSNNPEFAPRLKTLVILLLRRFRRTAAMNDLQQATIRAEGMIVATPPEHPERDARTKDWVDMMLVKGCREGFGEEDIECVVEMAQQPDKMQIPDGTLTSAEGNITTPAQHAALMELIHNEGVMSVLAGQRLLDEYHTTESPDDLDRAVEFWEKAVEHIPQNDPDPDVRCSRLTMLGGAYGLRYQRTGSTYDLDRAIELTTDALDFMAECPLVSDYLEFSAASFSDLESWLSQRFLRFGSQEDLHNAVNAAEMAVNLTPPDNPDWQGRMNDLGLRLGEQSEHDSRSSKEDLDRAIKCLEVAVDSGASLSSDDQDIRLVNLGSHLGTRFKSRGAVEDLDRSVEVLEKALYRSAPNRSLRCSILHHLAMVLVELYEHHGTDQDLDRAIEMQRRAIDETPEGHPDGVDRAVNLGLFLGKRAMKTGSMEDITRSVDAIQAEIQALPKDHNARPRLLMGLASSLDALSERTSSVFDLEDAIEAAKEAASSVSTDHHLHAAALNNLACMLGRRAERHPRSSETQDGPDAQSSDPFDVAIAAIKASVDATYEGHTDPPSRLCNLGDLLGKRFARSGSKNADDINDSIEATRQAVDISPRASHQRAMSLQNLGRWLLARHGQNGLAEDETDALYCFKEGWKSQNAAPFVRVTLAGGAARILAARSNWKEEDQLLEEAINLLPSITPRSLQHTDKQDMLAKYTGLASMAAAIALNAGKSAYDALKLLELGRGVIANRDGRLRWAQQEVDMVAELCPELHLQKSTPEPLKDEVLKDLQSCKIFHFAGHGQSDAAEPSQSCLLLQDWRTSPLTVADFRDSRLQDREAQPFLGYLSACSTGASEAARLADEGIHLISSLQLAGFRHVVGTLWEVSDQHCVDVARVFYETLRDEGMTDEAVCQGLHRATRALRNRSFSGELGQRKAFVVDDGITRRDVVDYRWVPYVHFGI
ncbi:hypothetical protein INS49_009832 [Diaporthe citri]|uniref:uncharacterized protein n=1 Tax=Diaporthe citri TaxID=83186 RepID=UPI001C7FE8DC|nr:uncharacterized protein INS49_009832 [Diaporthe citri]KAG6361605.1 hypothetical protein INS49_009832 [Diaporthe citri]